MSSPTIALYTDIIISAIRANIWADCQSSLGLYQCDYGDLHNLPADYKNWPTELPAVFIRSDSASMTEAFPSNRARFQYNLKLEFIRQQQEGENPKKVLDQAVGQLVAVLYNNGRNFVLPSLDGTPGLDIHHVFPRRIEFYPDEKLDTADFRLSIAAIDIEVLADSFPH